MTSLTVIVVSGIVNLRMFWREVGTGLTVAHEKSKILAKELNKILLFVIDDIVTERKLLFII